MTADMQENTKLNAAFFEREFNWLSQFIDTCLSNYFKGEQLPVPDAPEVSPVDGPYASFIIANSLSKADRLVLSLSLARHIKPTILDVFMIKNTSYDKRFVEFGGNLSSDDVFVPTVETALFLLGENHIAHRFHYYQQLTADNVLVRLGVLELNTQSNQTLLTAALNLSSEYLHYFITGTHTKPEYSESFPAQRFTTNLDWSDYVANEYTLTEINEVLDWLKHGESITEKFGLQDWIKPGFSVLFSGPPGTGKTLAAALLGKVSGYDVYRIKLSQVVSKYIGETEKNLKNIFTRAKNKRWILFFDEADALFGKHSNTAMKNEAFANQDLGYLSQCIDEYPGLIIVSNNLKANINECFLPDFQSVIYFTIPNVEQRLKLWKQSFNGMKFLDKAIDWPKIANDYELTGAAIINVLRYCCLKAIKNNTEEVSQTDIKAAIQKELSKA